jgi:hypothetical protein
MSTLADSREKSFGYRYCCARGESMAEGLDAVVGEYFSFHGLARRESVRGQNPPRKSMYRVLSPTKVEMMLS